MFECVCATHMSLARCVCVHVGCIAGALYYLSTLKPALQVSGLSEKEEEYRSLGWLSRWTLLKGDSPAYLIQACPE